MNLRFYEPRFRFPTVAHWEWALALKDGIYNNDSFLAVNNSSPNEPCRHLNQTNQSEWITSPAFLPLFKVLGFQYEEKQQKMIHFFKFQRHSAGVLFILRLLLRWGEKNFAQSTDFLIIKGFAPPLSIDHFNGRSFHEAAEITKFE